MIDIRLEEMTRRFGRTVALDDISLDFPAGSFTSLLGPSGCGKTTLLRLVAGFEPPDGGRVMFDGETIADPSSQVPPERRGVGVVFQSYALWPHMDVEGNVAYALTARGVARSERGRRVRDVLATVGLDGYGTRRIEELSGGQRQRVALARCLIAESKIILFDEPLANLDMHLRAAMVEVFRGIHRRTGATMIYVTHDQAEALALSDRIAVMDGGRILQIAPPTEIYGSPVHEKVAGFVGRSTILEGELVGTSGGLAMLEVAGHRFAARTTDTARRGRACVLLRPEGLKLAAEGMQARVISSIYRGPVHEVRLQISGSDHSVVLDCVDAPPVGCMMHVAVTDAWVVPAP
ncbi:ABC transporter ATP-binding protein [Chelativorans sp. AA-79]|uniref:ABC transporter ATP-binding protein n=1 Tax=Chelativorans sp. AA-79 TaxID=3028735 RepID=UPI0023F846B5|nr:ABC transporter ATP-binding protein [Chelativorans sp. AA-79]WEX08037.1 ABC transporter ATP-binding protein [Chelativorans sp. AA-79]